MALRRALVACAVATLSRLSSAGSPSHAAAATRKGAVQLDAGSLYGSIHQSQEVMHEGEDHEPIGPPRGARLVSIPVGSGGEKMAVFVSDEPVADEALQHAFVAIHGKQRDGGQYWTAVSEAVDKERRQRRLRNSTVVAPQFFSTQLNAGQYGARTLAWPDVNAWQAGTRASHPAGTKLTTLDALDAVVLDFADARRFPRLRNLTIVGHGGGGQLVQRFATVGADAPSHIHVRYIHGDASTCAYFTRHRPVQGDVGARGGNDGGKDGNSGSRVSNKQRHLKGVNRSSYSASSSFPSALPSPSPCPAFNTWRYGFDDFPGTAGGRKTAQQYYAQYVRRDVVTTVAMDDVAANGDQSCMAQLQGGTRRRDRNLAWYKYVHALGRSPDAVAAAMPVHFVGDGALPDWSKAGVVGLRLNVVTNASHDVREVLASEIGRSALFNDEFVASGLRLEDGRDDGSGSTL